MLQKKQKFISSFPNYFHKREEMSSSSRQVTVLTDEGTIWDEPAGTVSICLSCRSPAPPSPPPSCSSAPSDAFWRNPRLALQGGINFLQLLVVSFLRYSWKSRQFVWPLSSETDDFGIKAALILFIISNFVLFRQPGEQEGERERERKCTNAGIWRVSVSLQKEPPVHKSTDISEFTQCPGDLSRSRKVVCSSLLSTNGTRGSVQLGHRVQMQLSCLLPLIRVLPL